MQGLGSSPGEPKRTNRKYDIKRLETKRNDDSMEEEDRTYEINALISNTEIKPLHCHSFIYQNKLTTSKSHSFLDVNHKSKRKSTHRMNMTSTSLDSNITSPVVANIANIGFCSFIRHFCMVGWGAGGGGFESGTDCSFVRNGEKCIVGK